MKPDLSMGKLSETAFKLAQEAESYLEAVRRFGPGFDRNLTKSHRQCLLDEITKTRQVLQASLERKRLKEEDAWAYPRHMGSDMYIFLAADNPPKDNEARIPIIRFKSIVEELSKSVTEGRLDQQLLFLRGSFPHSSRADLGEVHSRSLSRAKRARQELLAQTGLFGDSASGAGQIVSGLK